MTGISMNNGCYTSVRKRFATTVLKGLQLVVMYAYVRCVQIRHNLLLCTTCVTSLNKSDCQILLLVFLALCTTSCIHTKTVDDYSDFNQMQQQLHNHQDPVTIQLKNGDTMKGMRLSFDRDSIGWVDYETGKTINVSTTGIASIDQKPTGKGALDGLGAGLIAGIIGGSVIGYASGTPGEQYNTPELKAIVLGVLGGGTGMVLGPIIGLAVGSKDRYVLQIGEKADSMNHKGVHHSKVPIVFQALGGGFLYGSFTEGPGLQYTHFFYFNNRYAIGGDISYLLPKKEYLSQPSRDYLGRPYSALQYSALKISILGKGTILSNDAVSSYALAGMSYENQRIKLLAEPNPEVESEWVRYWNLGLGTELTVSKKNLLFLEIRYDLGEYGFSPLIAGGFRHTIFASKER